jgi:hypothetical protein
MSWSRKWVILGVGGAVKHLTLETECCGSVTWTGDIDEAQQYESADTAHAVAETVRAVFDPTARIYPFSEGE